MNIKLAQELLTIEALELEERLLENVLSKEAMSATDKIKSFTDTD